MKFKAEIEISTREGILNPEEKAISNALKNKGLNLQNLVLNKKFYLEFCSDSMEKAKEDINNICSDLLANTIIQDYSIDLKEIK